MKHLALASSLVIAANFLSATAAVAGANLLKYCNYTSRVIFAAYSTYNSGVWNGYGWYRLDVSSCLDVQKNAPDFISVYAYASDGWESTGRLSGEGVSSYKVCVRQPGAFRDLDSRVCIGAPAGSEYQYKIGHIINLNNYNVYEVGFYN